MSPEERAVVEAINGGTDRQVAEAVLLVPADRLTPDSIAVTCRNCKGMTLLHVCMRHAHLGEEFLGAVRRLVACGADVNVKTIRGWTPR